MGGGEEVRDALFLTGGGGILLVEGSQAVPARPYNKDRTGVKRLESQDMRQPADFMCSRSPSNLN
jgi:hypothetical protein